MNYETILYREEGPVGWLTLNRPHDGNMFTPAMCHEIRDCINDVRRETRTRVLVITGAGNVFCAGADLAEARERTASSSDFRAWLALWRDTFRAIERCPKPVLAALNGMTLAGGLELALACDLMIAADNAVVGDVHCRYGLVPGGGGSQRLPEAVGTRRARWLMYTGVTLTAAQALEWGLVQAVVDHRAFHEGVHKIAATMARRSSVSLAVMKRLSMPRAITDEGLDEEIDAAAELIVGPDVREGLAAFFEKREPHFTGTPAADQGE
jgi:enoyl-CoA hydratase/carnithine racemase